MSRSRVGKTPFLLFVVLLIVAQGSALADDKNKPRPAPGKKPPPAASPNAPPPADTCAEATAIARYEGLGYTHRVQLRNGCAKAVECALWTDVDPEPRQTVRVAAGESAEIVTRRLSPARELTAHKSCTYR